MKKILLVFSILLPVLAIAQFDNVTLGTGNPYKVSEATDKRYFRKGDEILSVKVSKEKIILQKFNATSLSELNYYEYNDFPEGYVIEDILEFNNKFYLFYSLVVNAGKNDQLFIRKIDFEKGKFESAGKVLANTKREVIGTPELGYTTVRFVNKFDIFFSDDKSKMLIKYLIRSEKKEAINKYDVAGFSVYNSDLTELWTKEVKLPDLEYNMSKIIYSVDAQGSVYITSTLCEGCVPGTKKESVKTGYYIEILKVTSGTSNVQTNRVYLKDKYIASMRLTEVSPDQIKCVAFYKKGNSSGSVSGILNLHIKKDGTLSDETVNDFPDSILNYYENTNGKKKEKDANESSTPFAHLILKDVLKQESGNLLVIGEVNYIVSYTSANQTNNIGHYMDIVISEFDKEGKLKWIKVLPKKQSGSSENEVSYKYISGKENHYVVIGEARKNLKQSPNSETLYSSLFSPEIIVAYKISESTGNVTKIPLVDSDKVNGKPIFNFTIAGIVETNKDEFIFEAYKKGKEDILIKVKMK